MSAWEVAGQKRQQIPAQKSTSKNEGNRKNYQNKKNYEKKGEQVLVNIQSSNNNPANKLFSNMMSGGGKGAVEIKEVSLSDAYVAKDMTRSYELTRPPPEGFQNVLKKMFPSIDVCCVNSVDIKGKYMPSLFLHFNEQHDKGYSDFDKSNQINFSVQGIALRLIAVGNDRTDAEGTLIPKINKNIYATGVPYSLTRNPDYIKQVLSEWVEFDDTDPMKMVFEDGMYKGSIVIPVAEYKKIPPVIVNFPFFTLNNFGNYEQIPNATTKVNLLCKGTDNKMKPEQYVYSVKDKNTPLGQR